MGVYTTFTFLNADDTDDACCDLQPGAVVEHGDDVIEETDHEYGGWLVDLSKVPAGATHLLVSRG